MTIISISLNEKILEEIDKLQNDSGYSGRSEVIRAGIRSLLSESKDRELLTGRLKSVLLVVHDTDAEETITEIKHKFDDIIDTQIHSHLKGEKCLEIFILDGDAGRIKQLIKMPQLNKKVDYVKLIVT